MFIPSYLRRAKRYTSIRYNPLVSLYPVYTWYKLRQAKLSNGVKIPDGGIDSGGVRVRHPRTRKPSTETLARSESRRVQLGSLVGRIRRPGRALAGASHSPDLRLHGAPRLAARVAGGRGS